MGRRGRVSAAACLGIIEAAANLAMDQRIAWRLQSRNSPAVVNEVIAKFRRAQEEGFEFILPAASGEWFRLRYSLPEAAYALALIYIWARSSVASSESFHGSRDVLAAANIYLESVRVRTADSEAEGVKVALEEFDRSVAVAGSAM